MIYQSLTFTRVYIYIAVCICYVDEFETHLLDREKMKIAFDVDDVITEAPEFYSAITQSLIKNGHEVYIITDFDEHYRSYREKELKDYGIEYTELVITSEKYEFCKENDIQFAIDDDPSYYPDNFKSPISLVDLNR